MAKENVGAQVKPSSGRSKIPKEWPGAFGVYKYSKQAVMNNIEPLLLGAALLIIFSFLISLVFPSDRSLNFVGEVLNWLAGVYFGIFATILFISGVNAKKRELADTISDSNKYVLNMIVLNLLLSLIAIGTFLLLIIPFFIVMPRLVLANYFLVDKDKEPVEAIKASWHATDGNAGKVWGIFGAFFAMGLLSVTIIGIPFSIYFIVMYSAANAVLYFYLIRRRD